MRRLSSKSSWEIMSGANGVSFKCTAERRVEEFRKAEKIKKRYRLDEEPSQYAIMLYVPDFATLEIPK